MCGMLECYVCDGVSGMLCVRCCVWNIVCGGCCVCWNVERVGYVCVWEMCVKCFVCEMMFVACCVRGMFCVWNGLSNVRFVVPAGWCVCVIVCVWNVVSVEWCVCGGE